MREEPKLSGRERDERLAELAGRQRGVVSLEQLRQLDFDDDTIERRAGRSLFRMAPSVYAVGHTGLSRRGKGNAALLHAGVDSGLSKQSAARVWRISENPGEGPIHVSVRNRSSIAVADGVVLHRPRDLREDEIVLHRGLWVTTPERTVLDLLPDLSIAEITRMLELMVTVLNRSPDALHAWANDLGRVVGKAKLLRALDEVVGPAVIRSELETLFRTLCQEGGLPPALTNHRMGRWEVDAAWVDLMVAVELDSWKFHGGRWSFHRDRRKGADLSRMGFELLRFSWPQIKHDRRSAIEAVTEALERGRLRQLGRSLEAADRGGRVA